MEGPLEGAADEVGAGPGDLGVERLEARELQPHVRADLKIEMSRCAETMGRKIDDLNRDPAGAPLAKAGAQFDMGPLRLPAMVDRLRLEVPGKFDWVAV